MKQEIKDRIIAYLAGLLVLASLCTFWFVYKAKKVKDIKFSMTDTTKVHILYEDTWGKIILLKEEDL